MIPTPEKKYFNLVGQSTNNLRIERLDTFNCVIKDVDENRYEGFILATSPNGNAYTICDIDFHKSETDNKYQPRLTFKRTDKELQEKSLLKANKFQRISFRSGQDGYREFWRMIGFLNKFKELIDFGEFSDFYGAITNKDLAQAISKLTQPDELITLLEDKALENIQASTNLKLLKEYKARLIEFVENRASEKDIQNWLDEDSHKHRSQRAMIFGLEFINHTREGLMSGTRYDLLTRIGTDSPERILIELKSPSDDIFEIHEIRNINATTKEYTLSSSLSRAIPQILEYKRTIEDKKACDPDLERIGESEAIKIAKCIIVIGQRKSDNRWIKNLKALRDSLNSCLEIWAYSDLIDKLDSTITNLEQNNEQTT